MASERVRRNEITGQKLSEQGLCVERTIGIDSHHQVEGPENSLSDVVRDPQEEPLTRDFIGPRRGLTAASDSNDATDMRSSYPSGVAMTLADN
jgi:hypothetical protein